MGSNENNRDIQGHVNVSRDVHVGHDVEVGGNVRVEHDLRVDGWLDAPHIRGVNKGIFADEEELRAAYPDPDDGWYALVGTTFPATVYIALDGKWGPTGGVATPGDAVESGCGLVRQWPAQNPGVGTNEALGANLGYELHEQVNERPTRAEVAQTYVKKSEIGSVAAEGMRREFLSKKRDDRTAYQVSSDKAFEVGNYLPGASGGIIGIDAATGRSMAEVDELWVRCRAYFETLTIMEAETLAGRQYITPGGAVKCTRVDEISSGSALGEVTGYRCYFLSEQEGEKTETKIAVGDQAISEMFNARTGTTNKVSNHRYWRLVTDVSNDAYTDDAGNHYGYIELSATDCEGGSDIPQAGDVIAQLGNRTEARRQTAIILDTVGADAPSIKMYGGIGRGLIAAEHYSLNGKAIIAFGRDPQSNKVYFRLGEADASQYLNYTQDGGLEIAGKLSVGSSVGDKTLGDIADDAEKSTVSVQIRTDKGGSVLHNGEGECLLTAYVYYRNEEISSRIADACFSWERTSNDETGDRIWNRLHTGIGRYCTVTDADVERSAVFTCVVEIEQ